MASKPPPLEAVTALPATANRTRGADTRLTSISGNLRVLAVIVFIGIVTTTYWRLAELRATTLAETHQQMARLDMVLAEQTGRAMETIDFILRGIIEQSQFATAETMVTRDTIRRRIEGVRQLLAVDLVDATGRVIVTSRSGAPDQLPPAGLSLIARHQADPKAGLLFSEPLHQADGAWTVLVSRRVEDQAQHFGGIAVAWVNLLYFEDFYKTVELSENGAIMLHRRDGTVLARSPHDEKLVGVSYAELPPFKQILAQNIAGTLEMDSPLDGSRRILAIRALRSFPLAVNISVDESYVLSAWRREAWTLAGAAVVLAMLIAALLLLIAARSREVETLLAASRRAQDAAEAANNDLIFQMEERARAEAALRQAQRVEAVGQLTGGLAHDFNNLLTVVLGNIELLEKTPGTGPFASRLATMRAAAQRGAALTTQLLAFAGRQPLMPRPVDLADLIRGMKPLIESAVGAEIDVELDLDATLPPAQVDPTQIELVILNLAINARDAMPEGGTVRLSTDRRTLHDANGPDSPPPGEYVCIKVSDTGIGMIPNVLVRAFEPFFTTKSVGDGSGLGLSQVYGTARQSGGTARIVSTPGLGTTVEVMLPRSFEDMPPPARSADTGAARPSGKAPPPEGRRTSLLVVDDDPDVRITTAMLLRRLGYQVTEAGGGAEALDILQRDRGIDLLLSDVVMPITSGPELARQAQALRPNLPVVFFSGYADPDAIAGAGQLARLLSKPFRPAELVRSIEEALEESRANTLPPVI